ncbi:MAG: hypothetical protein ACT4PW_08555 [Acidimicrobiia bacterium]
MTTSTPPSEAAASSTAGTSIMAASWAGTAVLAVAALAAAAAPDEMAGAYAVLAGLLFVAGSAAFVWAFVLALRRSRTDQIGVSSLFLLSGSAPSTVRRRLLGALGAQTVVALAAASARPYTAVAFGILAPTFGLGLGGLWAAQHGTFPPRPAGPGAP